MASAHVANINFGANRHFGRRQPLWRKMRCPRYSRGRGSKLGEASFERLFVVRRTLRRSRDSSLFERLLVVQKTPRGRAKGWCRNRPRWRASRARRTARTRRRTPVARERNDDRGPRTSRRLRTRREPAGVSVAHPPARTIGRSSLPQSGYHVPQLPRDTSPPDDRARRVSRPRHSSRKTGAITVRRRYGMRPAPPSPRRYCRWLIPRNRRQRPLLREPGHPQHRATAPSELMRSWWQPSRR